MRKFFEIVAQLFCCVRLRRTLTAISPTCSATGSVPSNFGQELVRGLLNADPTLAVPSSAVAASLIRGSTRAKDYFLQLPVEAAPGTNGPHRLVLQTLSATVANYFDVPGAHFCFSARHLSPQIIQVRQSSQSTLIKISAGGPQEERARPLAAAAATLLVDWLVDCPKAVAALLQAPGWVDATSAALIERYVESAKNVTPRKNSIRTLTTLTFPNIRRRPLPSDDWICCLSAVLLGECMLYCGEDVQVRARGRLLCGDFDQVRRSELTPETISFPPQNSPRPSRKTSSCPAWGSPSTLARSGGSSRTFRSTVSFRVCPHSCFLYVAVRRSFPYLQFPVAHL